MNLTIQWTQAWAQKNNIPLKYYVSTTSTQDEAKALQTLTTQPLCILAQRQTKGRGRHQRTWTDSDFMSSWTWKTHSSVNPQLSVQIGKKLCEICQHIWPSQNWRFKEPNDLYLNQKKIAGLLIEVLPTQNKFQVIVGLGMNVLNTPPLDEAGSISKLQHIQQSQWHLFLSEFYQYLKTIDS